MRRLAKQIRETLAVSRDGDFSLTEPDQREDTETFPEGRVLERAHKVRERNRSVITKKFAEVVRLTGKLACEACGFDYEAAYGELGQGYAECHHNVPLSAMGIRQTRLQDLAVVCSNCHAMIHHRRPWLTVAELKELVRR